MNRCPSCGSRGIGRVATDQYYCWDCCVEFTAGRSGVKIYQINEEGEMIAMHQHHGEGEAAPEMPPVQG